MSLDFYFIMSYVIKSICFNFNSNRYLFFLSKLCITLNVFIVIVLTVVINDTHQLNWIREKMSNLRPCRLAVRGNNKYPEMKKDNGKTCVRDYDRICIIIIISFEVSGTDFCCRNHLTKHLTRVWKTT
jgi:hypothetical protein